MPATPKEFVLTHVIKDVSKLSNKDDVDGGPEEHFGASWEITFDRNGDNFGIYLSCEPPAGTEEYSIEVARVFQLISVTGKVKIEESNFCYSGKFLWGGYQCDGIEEFIGWKTMLDEYVVDNMITIQVHVKISEITGIEKKKQRNFDETMKQYSDVVLVVEDKKFYVSKLFVAGQSSYFEAMFMRKFKESDNSVIRLSDVSAKGFQNFLELLHGDPAIDDDTVIGILKLADMYDAKTGVRRCEEFLVNESQKQLKEKLLLSIKYNLRKLKESCLQNIKTVDDIKSVMPGDLNKLDQSTSNALLQKALSFHN